MLIDPPTHTRVAVLKNKTLHHKTHASLNAEMEGFDRDGLKGAARVHDGVRIRGVRLGVQLGDVLGDEKAQVFRRLACRISGVGMR